MFEISTKVLIAGIILPIAFLYIAVYLAKK